jgi:hypothetical protein
MKTLKKITIILTLLTSCCLVNGQDTAMLIKQIRSDYQQIQAKKNDYIKKVIDKSKELYAPDDSTDEAIRKKIITIFFDKEKIVLIEIKELFDLWMIVETNTEYYLKDNSIFFIYQCRTMKEWGEGYNDKDKETDVREQRFYFYNEKCVKYLEKNVKGKLSEIENMIRKAPNIEKDCSEEEYTIRALIDETKMIIEEL